MTAIRLKSTSPRGTLFATAHGQLFMGGKALRRRGPTNAGQTSDSGRHVPSRAQRGAPTCALKLVGAAPNTGFESTTPALQERVSRVFPGVP
jgi:hypothetical protein